MADMKKFHQKMLEILVQEQIVIDAPMKNYSTFKVGGPADMLVLPDSAQEVQMIIALCREEKIPFLIVGNGSNLLIGDEGYGGLVVKLSKNFSKITVDEANCQIKAEAGALIPAVAKEACNHSLSGMERISGIPGSVGGGVLMNAGAYESEMKDILYEITYLTKDGEICTTPATEAAFSYRHSRFQEDGSIVLSAVFRLKKENQNEIKETMSEYAKKRNEKQPVHLPSAGSTFKRPEGHFAGKLIEDAGLKGLTVGGAAISELHAGFVVNENNATAQDVLDVIALVQATVKDRFGVSLEPEVKIVTRKTRFVEGMEGNA